MLNEAQRSTAPRRWHNHLPAWIVTDPRHGELTPAGRAVLQAIADVCDPPDDAGDLRGGFGGQAVLDAAGVSRSTFWRQLSRLVALGFVVQIGRGGTIKNRNIANLYAIPGARSRLDHLRCVRRHLQMLRGEDGKHRPRVLHPGDQAVLFDQSTKGGVVSKSDGGSVRMTRGWCQNEAPPSPLGSPLASKPSGAARRRCGKTGPSLRHVSGGDLTSLARLHVLFREAGERKLIGRDELDWRTFVGLAVHARRVGDDPPAMFATLVRKRRWLIPNRDFDRAEAWIKDAEWRSALGGDTDERDLEADDEGDWEDV